ncbi:uncharacterized protein isoform X1 [Salmo salar]|uniref:Uncharacterized protein isoform X1 n=2 Tax=Salmo salar TaxID=8030 RepID=A0ABM3E397_SALSA|nr:uncharacterized protein LOC123730934 isoform X1 [Salmo salar]
MRESAPLPVESPVVGISDMDASRSENPQKQRKKTAGPSTAGIIGGIIGVVLLLVIVGAVVMLVRKRKQNAENGDGPPKHKPPPPVKTGSSTEMLNKHVTDPVTKEVTETQPLSKVYYETSGEPVTDLDACDDDDDNTRGGGAANGGGPAVLEDSIQYADIDDTLNDGALPPYSGADGHHVDEPPSTTVARGESFVSAAMYV